MTSQYIAVCKRGCLLQSQTVQCGFLALQQRVLITDCGFQKFLEFGLFAFFDMNRLLTLAVEDVLSGKFSIRAAVTRDVINRGMAQTHSKPPAGIPAISLFPAFVQAISVLRIKFHVCV